MYSLITVSLMQPGRAAPASDVAAWSSRSSAISSRIGSEIQNIICVRSS